MVSSNRDTTGSAVLPDEYENLRIGVILHDPMTGEVLDANRRLESMYGYATSELRTMNVGEFTANTYHFSQREAERRIRAAAEGHPQHFEWRVKRSDGELIWTDVHLTTLRVAGQPYVLGEIRDITEYKTNVRRLKLFHRLLQHNLRNDVNVISGYADQIEPDRDVADLVTAAERIQQTAEGLNQIAESVKQIEETLTRENTSRTITRVVDVVSSIADEYREAYPQAAISVTERTELWIETGEALRHALNQAIENAIVHNDQAEPIVRIRIDESPNTGRVEITLSDTGPTIPADEIAALDDYEETTNTKHGSGVGLFVMKWCAESLGGEVKFEENTPRGNVVSFYFPPKSPEATLE